MRKIVKFTSIYGEKTTETPIECNSQRPSVQFKYHTHTPKTSPVVYEITGRLNNHVIDNSDVNVYTSDYALESNYDSFLDPYKPTMKPIDDDEMYQVPELFHSEDYDDLLDIDIQMLQT